MKPLCSDRRSTFGLGAAVILLTGAIACGRSGPADQRAGSAQSNDTATRDQPATTGTTGAGSTLAPNSTGSNDAADSLWVTLQGCVTGGQRVGTFVLTTDEGEQGAAGAATPTGEAGGDTMGTRGTSATRGSQTAGTQPGAASAHEYALESVGAEADLAPHVGKRVEVTGRFAGTTRESTNEERLGAPTPSAGQDTMGTTGKRTTAGTAKHSNVQMQMMRVESIRDTGGICQPKANQRLPQRLPKNPM